MTEKLKFAAASHVGLVRENNEDSYAIVYPGVGYPLALILADGMGGHSKGEVASRIAVEFIASFLREDLVTPRSLADIGKRLPELIKKANIKVYLASLDHEENRGMGTTLTTLVIKNDRLTFAHIGDCRAYLLHNNILKQLTIDHTLVQEMVDAGSLTAEETQNHPRRNVLTRALGFPEFISPDVAQVPVAAGDTIILCSDGLHGFVPDQAIARFAQAAESPEQLVDQLIQAALSAGGEDNVTILAVQVKMIDTMEGQS
ncbi:MAG: protein phosphatase [Firmicutes bacterium]|nr:protein phosphatase [Bacillota bacterium]